MLFLAFSVVLTSCAPDPSAPLSWNREELTFVGSYEENGVTFTARFSVKGGDADTASPLLYGRSATVTLLSPTEVEGIVYRLDGTGYSVAREGHSFLLSSCPAPLLALLLFYPVDATLGAVETDGDTRRETVYAADGTYTYVYPSDGDRPTAVTKTDGVAYRSLTVTAWE